MKCQNDTWQGLFDNVTYVTYQSFSFVSKTTTPISLNRKHRQKGVVRHFESKWYLIYTITFCFMVVYFFFMPHTWRNFERQFLVDFIYFPFLCPFHINTETKVITYLHIYHKKLSVRLQVHRNSHNSSFLTTVRHLHTRKQTSICL